MVKFFPKILTVIFLSIFIVQLFFLILLLALPQASQAADIKFKPQVGIPVKKQPGDIFDFSGNQEINFSQVKSTKPIAEYIRVIYRYAIGIVGILAAVVLMIGGVLWIVAGGNATQIGEAKAWIGAALTGLVLALTSYLILSTVNPALVNLQITQIPGVEPVVEVTTNSCCSYWPMSAPAPGAGVRRVCFENQPKSNCPNDTYYMTNGKCNGNNECVDIDKITGSCTTEICQDDYTKNDCDSMGGEFAEGKKCPVLPTGCCSYDSSKSGWSASWDCAGNITKNDCKKLKSGQYIPNKQCQSNRCI